MRKWLGVVLLVCALALAGCEGGVDSAFAPEGAISADKIYLSALQYEPDDQNIDFGNLWFFEELEKRTNVHVDFTEIKGAEWDAKLSLMFASGNYADIIIRGEVDDEEYGVQQNILVPLDDYLEECMPNYYSRLKLNGAGDSIPASDGKSYYVGFLISQNVCADGHFFINQAWLDALGLAMPQTVDELTQTLRAFRDRDPNGNGEKDETPYAAATMSNNSGIYNAFAFWGVPMNPDFVFIDDEERVRFAPACDGYRECVEWLNTLYTEGLLDPECLTQAQSLFNVKLNANTAGFFSYWRLTNTSLKPEIASQFKCILPVSAQGARARLPRTLEIPRLGAALTVSNKHIKETLKWLDAQMETETMLIAQNGKPGDTLVKRDDGVYEVKYVPDGNKLYEIVPVIYGQCFAPSDYCYDIFEMAPHHIEKLEYCQAYEAAGVVETRSYQELTDLAPITGAESARLAYLKAPIQTAINGALARMVFGGVTDANWREFEAGFDKLGVSEYVSIYQAAYDRYLGLAGVSK